MRSTREVERYWFTALLCVAMAIAFASGALSAPVPALTVTPTEISSGSVVTFSMQMKGNTSGPASTVNIQTTVEYWDEGATAPTMLPPITTTLTLLGTGAPVRNPKWTMTLPAGWTYASEPKSVGYLGASVLKGADTLTFNATQLPPDVTATTTWTMRVP
jgi:hypothetical protein